MSLALAAATSPPAGGAPLDQVIIATAAGMLLTVGLLVVGLRYRAGKLALLDRIAAPFTWLLRVPAWAALPVALATGALLLAGAGFYWDVSVHIDRGRDPGPFGTPAHYPILIGLFGIFAAGWLALVMARGEDARRTGIRLSEGWVVPTSGVVMSACGAFALLGFPLDDIWHATFGQDVTLWGPTHLIMLTGGQLMIPTILGLLCEGRAARGLPAATGEPIIPGRIGRVGAFALAVTGTGGLLAGLTIYQAEFGFGVPQYNLLFQPALLAFTAGLSLVCGRAIVGRGGALASALVNIIISGAFVVFVAGIAGQATPHFSSYLPAALAVELAAVLIAPRRIAAFAVLAGVLVGTLGTVGEWGWTHVWMPIPWPTHFVPSAVEIAIPAGICGALVGAFVAGALSPGRVPRLGTRPWAAGALGAVGLAAILAFCLPTHAPRATGTIVLGPVSQIGGVPSAQATVTIRPASTVSSPDYVQQLSWQGHTTSVEGLMRRVAPGVYRTVAPLPLGGSWKSLVRVQQGRMRADLPVYLPADPAIPAALIPAKARITRALVPEHTLMQRERKRDVPGWLWNVATGIVLVIIAVLLAIIGWGLNRVSGLDRTPPPQSRGARGEPVVRRRPAAPFAASSGARR